MLFRLIVCVFLSACFSMGMATENLTKEDSRTENQTLFELERNVAVLQLSSASVKDVQILENQIEAFNKKVYLLSNLLFLMFIALMVCAYHLYRQQKRLINIEKKKLMT